MVSILNEAAQQFADKQVPKNQGDRDEIWEQMEEMDELWDELNDRFCAIEEKLFQLTIEYLKSNATLID